MTVECVSTTDTAAAAAVTTTDPLTVIAIQTLSQAVDMLREDLGIANSFLLAERERAGQAERRVDELQGLLTEERRQAQTSAPDIRGIIKEVIREIAGAAPPDNRDDDRERLQTLETTIAALQEQVEYAESGVVAERQRAEQAEHRVDELQVALADARTAAMITGYEAAALRTQLALLTERRPWWRRWFR
jgi:outer membrane murein-binding lipoprotein Lpp